MEIKVKNRFLKYTQFLRVASKGMLILCVIASLTLIVFDIKNYITSKNRLAENDRVTVALSKQIESIKRASSKHFSHETNFLELNSTLQSYFDAFGKLRGYSIKIKNIEKSQFINYIKVDLQINDTPDAIHEKPTLLDEALLIDYLKLFGYLEIFDNKKAILHIKD